MIRLYLYAIIFGIILPLNLVFAAVSPNVLSKEVLLRFSRVPEYKFIIETAKKYNVKVYLFGGTGSAFGHYVRWDLERENGDDTFQPERFDYDFTSIYRGNQDLDIVIDADENIATAFESELNSKFPHFIGQKDAWEVRLLKVKRGVKPPLLGDLDFQNQHSDSNSTGLILLNPNTNDNQIFYDLRDWNNRNSLFLRDIAGGKITYLYSRLHEETERYKSGHNDPILSVIRYLAKLTQYEVIPQDSDLKVIEAIIQKTDFAKLSSYNQRKFVEFGIKALLNSPNVEYANDLLTRLGLLPHLIQFGKNYTYLNHPMSFWFEKEPLRSKPLGQGRGIKASELGLDIVSHETKTFQAYENITRSTRNLANVFISREKYPGESANYGNGFYTRVGRTGAVGSGITIRFKINPEAREGVDFTYQKEVGYVIVTNKNALSLIHENLNLSFLDFIKIYSAGLINSNDKGLIEKLKRKFTRQAIPDDIGLEVYKIMKTLDSKSPLFAFWLELGVSKYHLEHAEFLMENNPFLFLKFIKGEVWVKHSEIHDKFLDKYPDMYKYFAVEILTLPHWGHRKDWIFRILNEALVIGDDVSFMTQIINKPHWVQYQELLDALIANNVSKNLIIDDIMAMPYFLETRSDLVEHWMEDESTSTKMLKIILANGGVSNFQKWISRYLVKSKNNKDILNHINSFHDELRYSGYSPEKKLHYYKLLHTIVESGNEEVLVGFLKKTSVYFIKFYDSYEIYNITVKAFSRNIAIDQILAVLSQQTTYYVFYNEKYLDNVLIHQILDKILERGQNDHEFIRLILSKDTSIIKSQEFHQKRLEWIRILIQRGTSNSELIRYVFSKEFMVSHSELLDEILSQNSNAEDIIRYVLPLGNRLKKFDQLIEFYLQNDQYDYLILKYVLDKSFIEKREMYFKLIFDRSINKLFNVIESQNSADLNQIGSEYFSLVLRVLKKLPKNLQINWLSKLIFSTSISNTFRRVIDFDDKIWKNISNLNLTGYGHLLNYFFKNPSLRTKVLNYLSNHEDLIAAHPEWIHEFVKNKHELPDLIRTILSSPKWQKDDSIIQFLIDMNDQDIDKKLAEYLFNQEYWSKRTDWIEILILRGHANYEIVSQTMTKNNLYTNVRLMTLLFAKQDFSFIYYINNLLSRPGAYIEESWIHHLLNLDFKDHPDSERLKTQVRRSLVSYVLNKDRWYNNPEILQRILDEGLVSNSVAQYILTIKRWMNPDWARLVIDNPNVSSYAVKDFLSTKHWEAYPEIVEYAYLNKKLLGTSSQGVFKFEHWKTHPEFVAYVGKPKVNYREFASRMKQITFSEWRAGNTNANTQNFTGSDNSCTHFLDVKIHP